MRDEQDSKNLVGHKASFIVRVSHMAGLHILDGEGSYKAFPERLGINKAYRQRFG